MTSSACFTLISQLPHSLLQQKRPSTGVLELTIILDTGQEHLILGHEERTVLDHD